MNTKPPALLVVLIEADALRWSVAGISEANTLIPLVQSAPGDLSGYMGLSFDEQVSFIRHRLAGAVQRGCDRLWGRQLKPFQFVFVQIDEFRDAPDHLTQRVADHFCEWMVNPPTAFCFAKTWQDSDLRKLAGEIEATHFNVVRATMSELLDHVKSSDHWEIVPARNQC